MSFITQAGLKANGEVWTWGGGFAGVLGTGGALAYISSPVSVVGAHAFVYMSIREHAIALKANGEAWGWGENASGRIGDDTTTDRNSPVSVVGSHAFSRVACNLGGTVALKADGTAWSWGLDSAGMGGRGTDGVNVSSPVSVVGEHTFTQIATMGGHVQALKANGEAWGWGNGSNGRLGNGSGIATNSSPISVLGEHSFIKICVEDSCSLALKADGQVWSWGLNTQGQLGNDSTTGTSSPISVVGDHTFVDLVAGRYCAFALKADGTLWSWGRNALGNLGDGTATDRSSPISVVGEHSFVAIYGIDFSAAARKANGEVWCWGQNTSGQLGDGTWVNKSSPVLVVGSHNFALIPEYESSSSSFSSSSFSSSSSSFSSSSFSSSSFSSSSFSSSSSSFSSSSFSSSSSSFSSSSSSFSSSSSSSFSSSSFSSSSSSFSSSSFSSSSSSFSSSSSSFSSSSFSSSSFSSSSFSSSSFSSSSSSFSSSSFSSSSSSFSSSSSSSFSSSSFSSSSSSSSSSSFSSSSFSSSSSSFSSSSFSSSSFSSSSSSFSSSSSSSFSSSSYTYHPTEFVCKIGLDGPPSRDYKTLSIWDAACRCDLTVATTRVYATSYHSGNTYDVQDNKQVYLYRGGVRLGTRAWLLHATATQTLVRSIQGPDTPQVGDQWRQTGGNSYGWVTLQDVGDSAIAVAECYNDQVMIDFVNLYRWVTSPTNNIKIYTPSSERHSGRAGTGFVIAKYTVDTLIDVSNVDVHIQGIEFAGGGRQIEGTYRSDPHTIEIEACIFHDNNWGHAIDTPDNEDLTIKIWNCFFYNTYASAIGSGHRNGALYVENCSIFNPGSIGVVRAQCYNVVTHKGIGTQRRPADPGNFPGFGDECTGDYNCDGSETEDDGSAPGVNSLHNQDLKAISWISTEASQVISDEPGEDSINLHAHHTSVLVGAGTDRSAGDIGFDDDIDGDTREVPWTIGGDQTTYSSSSSSESSGSGSSSSSSGSSRFYLYIRDYVID